MCLATSSYNPTKQETNSSIADAFLRAAVPINLPTAHCKPAQQKASHANRIMRILQTSSSKSVCRCMSFIEVLTCKSGSITAVSCASCRQFSQIEARRNTDPTFATLGATIPVKTQFFAPESASPLEIICSWAPLLPTYLVISHEVDQVDMMV